ncbi:MAG: recombination protein RecR [Alloprevotella sp.]|nr:recombination protein RecR [Alloprevotella sp.]
MEQQYPSRLLERCVSEFAKLPGIGRRTALRLVLKLLKQKPEEAHALAESLTALVDNVKYCSVCHNISDTDVCDICANPLRDHSTICVVENVRSVLSIEQTGAFRGLYHVLGGIISPMDGVGPSQLEIDPLVERVATGDVKEVIFALSPTMEGDTTNFYISRRLEGMPVRLTTLARGLSVGDDLEYADEVTLGRSIRARVDLKNKA